jgi:HNH endonuclease
MERPSIRQIVSYWESRVDESDLGVDMAEAAERCWRCGYRSKLERCHIVPKSLDGSNEPSNFVLLCGRCHREAPNTRNVQFMWHWIRATKQPLYDTYWTQRGFDEFARILGRQPFEGLSPITFDEIQPLLRAAMQDAEFHWGECGMSPSTIAAVLADIESRLRTAQKA